MKKLIIVLAGCSILALVLLMYFLPRGVTLVVKQDGAPVDDMNVWRILSFTERVDGKLWLGQTDSAGVIRWSARPGRYTLRVDRTIYEIRVPLFSLQNNIPIEYEKDDYEIDICVVDAEDRPIADLRVGVLPFELERFTAGRIDWRTTDSRGKFYNHFPLLAGGHVIRLDGSVEIPYILKPSADKQRSLKIQYDAQNQSATIPAET